MYRVFVRQILINHWRFSFSFFPIPSFVLLILLFLQPYHSFLPLIHSSSKSSQVPSWGFKGHRCGGFSHRPWLPPCHTWTSRKSGGWRGWWSSLPASASSRSRKSSSPPLNLLLKWDRRISRCQHRRRELLPKPVLLSDLPTKWFLSHQQLCYLRPKTTLSQFPSKISSEPPYSVHGSSQHRTEYSPWYCLKK